MNRLILVFLVLFSMNSTFGSSDDLVCGNKFGWIKVSIDTYTVSIDVSEYSLGTLSIDGGNTVVGHQRDIKTRNIELNYDKMNKVSDDKFTFVLETKDNGLPIDLTIERDTNRIKIASKNQKMLSTVESVFGGSVYTCITGEME